VGGGELRAISSAKQTSNRSWQVSRGPARRRQQLDRPQFLAQGCGVEIDGLHGGARSRSPRKMHSQYILSVHELAFATRSHVHWKRLVDGRSGAGQIVSIAVVTAGVAPSFRYWKKGLSLMRPKRMVAA
jgi:hypothetical protein